jgi:hypothetical protein
VAVSGQTGWYGVQEQVRSGRREYDGSVSGEVSIRTFFGFPKATLTVDRGVVVAQSDHGREAEIVAALFSVGMLASVIYSGLLVVGVIRDRRRHGFKPKLWAQRTGWRLLWDRVSEAWPPRYFISVTLVVVVGMMSIGLMFSGLSRGTVPADVKHELVSRADVAVRNEQLLVAGVDRYSRNGGGSWRGKRRLMPTLSSVCPIRPRPPPSALGRN